MGRPTKMPAVEVVKADVEAGMTNLALAEKYGVGESVVSSFLTNRGIRRKPKPSRPSVDEIAERIRKGMAPRKIAAEFGVHTDVISRIMFKHKLKQPKPEIQAVGATLRSPQAGPAKIVDERGISLPRLICIHGPYEGAR